MDFVIRLYFALLVIRYFEFYYIILLNIYSISRFLEAMMSELVNE